MGDCCSDSWKRISRSCEEEGRLLPLDAPVIIPSFPSRGRYPLAPPRFVDAVLVCSDDEVSIVCKLLFCFLMQSLREREREREIVCV
jgi:hypothetical protein